MPPCTHKLQLTISPSVNIYAVNDGDNLISICVGVARTDANHCPGRGQLVLISFLGRKKKREYDARRSAKPRLATRGDSDSDKRGVK